jgi:hypothetical protein
VVADEDEPLVEVANVRGARPAVWFEAPFEDRARDVERAGDDAVAFAVQVGANVDQHSSAFDRRECIGWFIACDPCAGSVEELVERLSVGADCHQRIIGRAPPLV